MTTLLSEHLGNYLFGVSTQPQLKRELECGKHEYSDNNNKWAGRQYGMVSFGDQGLALGDS